MKMNILFFVLVVSVSSFGKTIHVPADKPTIQSAIDMAVTGDLIIVSPGTYSEAISFGGKIITVQSINPNDPSITEQTIIDATNAGLGLGSPYVVAFASDGDNAVLAGFTITGGTDGIYGHRSRATIRDCVIHHNNFSGISDHYGIISHCVIRDNGIGLSACKGSVIQSIIENNETGINGFGSYYYDTNPISIIIDTKILNNETGIVDSYNTEFLRCVISKNRFTALEYSFGLLMRQCLISGNGYDSDVVGSVKFSGRIENSIISGNFWGETIMDRMMDIFKNEGAVCHSCDIHMGPLILFRDGDPRCGNCIKSNRPWLPKYLGPKS
mgnify:CR=1 FL=1